MHNLVLTVIKAPVDTLLNSFFKFDQKSGTIGRGQSNDWVLLDPECILSGKHLEIVYDQGVYRAKDTSSNGSFLHPSNEELDKAQGTLIQHDHVFEIGDFLLKAHLEKIEIQQPQVAPQAIAQDTQPTASQPVNQATSQTAIKEPEAKKLSPFDISDATQDISDYSNTSLEGTQEISPAQKPQTLPSSAVVNSGIGNNESATTSSLFSEPASHSILGQAPSNTSPLTQNAMQEPPASVANNAPASGSKVPEDWDSDETINDDINNAQAIQNKDIDSAPITPPSPSPTAPEALTTQVLDGAPESTVGSSSKAQESINIDANNHVSGNEFETNTVAPVSAPVLSPNQTKKEHSADSNSTGIKPPRPKPRPALSQTDNSNPNLNGNEYQHFLNDLGLSGMSSANHSPELFAEIFSLVTEQLISILRSRNKVRQQFRLAVTSIQKSDNNPLTFSVNTEDAIHNLFVKQNAGYLPAMDSYEQAFSTIEHHQLAVVVGMRAGFENMLSAFSPESLSGLKPKTKDKKWWHIFSSDKEKFEDNYDAHYKHLLKNKEQTFIQLFGEAFTHAYELSVHQQKSEEKLRKENV